MKKEALLSNPLKILFCLLFAAFETMGILLYKYDILDIDKFSYGWCETLSIYLFSSVLSYIFVDFIINLIFKARSSCGETTNSGKFNNPWCGLLIWCAIAACWLVWIIAYYPGSPFWDMSYQLAQYYKLQEINLHPPFSTMVMGICMDVGQALFRSDNVGFFLYIFLQFLVLSFACAKTCLMILRITKKPGICIAATLFYALFPLFGASVQSGMKDTMSYALTLLAMIDIYSLFQELHETNKITIKNFIEGILVSFLSCLYRKEMVYLYILVILAFALYSFLTKKAVKWILVCVTTALLVVGLSGPFSNKVIAEGFFGQTPSVQSAESLSIPLQHVARYVTFYDNELTEAEKEIIGNCFSYGYEGIKSNYNPNLSDPIKYNFSTNTAKENGFWNVYLRLLKRKPFLFVESVLASGYGYCSIVPNVPATINDAPTNGLPGSRIPNLFINDFSEDRESQGYKTEYSAETEELREFLNDYAYSFQVPYNLLYSFGFYTWLVVLLFVIAVLTKGWQVIVYYALPALLILVCIASPVNDYCRYYMGIIYIVPILLGDILAPTSTYQKEITHATGQEE